MARKPQNGQAATIPSDLPELLASALSTAEAGCFPSFTDEEQQGCPTLFAILSPQLVGDPQHKGKGEPRKVLREPLLMISWDRAGGCWKWSITDKVLNLGWDGPLPQLVGAAEKIESQLREGKYRVKKKKVT